MIAIRFDGVSKKFILHRERVRSFQELTLNLFRRDNSSREEFWALRDVSFDVRQGETVGIIGPNGAGKSTALKLISHIIEPTSGRIEVNGRVGALLELGAGFHPDLTGLENIYLNGSILGLSRAEVRRKLDEIISFAELERFIDVPVKHYSSGMYVRLGFSVAVHTNPEVLLVDEVLAVGDQSFQAKCLDRIVDLRRQGLTILFVSHSVEAVRNLCTKAVWLDHGLLRGWGATDKVTQDYVRHVIHTDNVQWKQQRPAVVNERRWGSGEVEIVDVQLLDAQGGKRNVFATGERVTVRMRYQAHQPVDHPVFGIGIHRNDGLHINGPNTKMADFPIDRVEGSGEVCYEIEHLPLLRGTYEISVAVYDYDCLHAYDHHDRTCTLRVQPGAVRETLGLILIPARWQHVPDGASHG